MRSNVIVGLCLIALICSAVGAADWPNWRGPDYNGISKETGFDAQTGKELWKTEWATKHDVNASDPVIYNDYFFVASGYNRGCGLFKVTGPAPTKLYDNKNMRSQLSGPVLANGKIYTRNAKGAMVCIDVSGK